MQRLLLELRACTICSARLPLPPRPVLQVGAAARILIAGQAPGRKVAASGVPFDDASGDRLRAWMGIDKAGFYDPDFIAILPMGFCYPGTGTSGDLPPRPECAATWRARLLEQLPSIRLTLVVGTHAQAWHLKPEGTGANLTATVGAWREHGARVLPLPHPSPRNNGWLKRNPWFEADVLPELKTRVRALQGR
ncbi:MAG: IclR family transcriptional regulator [Comamonadaceae bacterium SCN 68-20]|nr:MAG: IclR family transcriptional regulator [Comamonadaceae bacterium SCN 68-20]